MQGEAIFGGPSWATPVLPRPEAPWCRLWADCPQCACRPVRHKRGGSALSLRAIAAETVCTGHIGDARRSNLWRFVVGYASASSPGSARGAACGLIACNAPAGRSDTSAAVRPSRCEPLPLSVHRGHVVDARRSNLWRSVVGYASASSPGSARGAACPADSLDAAAKDCFALPVGGLLSGRKASGRQWLARSGDVSSSLRLQGIFLVARSS
jgi:hypothetical protein